MVANKNKSEKNKDKKIDILKLIHYGIVLMIFSSVSALILIGTHDLTKATVAKHLKQEIEEARESVLPGTVKFVDNKALKVGKLEYIPGYDKNKKVIGYVCGGDEPR